MPCYRHFTLARGSSPGFGSTARNYDPLHTAYAAAMGTPPYSDSLSLRLRLAA